MHYKVDLKEENLAVMIMNFFQIYLLIVFFYSIFFYLW